MAFHISFSPGHGWGRFSITAEGPIESWKTMWVADGIVEGASLLLAYSGELPTALRFGV